ncbi:MAG: thioredoxin fold domain-containing protein [candidate division Zixibacteria bacterium]|nr:thioredoxin fold domain-containing protein [candidate division Zixibacteria bacterium]
MRQTKSVLVVVAVMLLVMACAQKEIQEPLESAPYHTSLAEAKQAAGVPGKPILVEFSTDWCTWCATIDTVVLVDSAVIEFLSGEMILVKIDAEADSALAREHHISGYPTTVMLDENGEEIDRLVGYVPPEEYIQTFRDYAKGIGTLDDLLTRVKTESDRALYLNIADKYKYRGAPEEAGVWFTRVVDEGDPRDSLSGESRLALADMMRRSKNWDDAIKAYEAVSKDFSGTETGDDAQVWIAIVYRNQGDTTEALKRFEAFAKANPGTENAEYCQKQIEKLTAKPEEEVAE